MRNVVGAINMTLDGFCDHTAVIPDEALHWHYTELLRQAGVILYGRITYQLMEYWKTVVENPTGQPDMDEFAKVIDEVPKVVFSHTLSGVDWDTARLAHRSLAEELEILKNEPGSDILVGSRSLLISLLNLGLLDELQLCVHPVLAGSGLPLFENHHDRRLLHLKSTKELPSGAIVLIYGRAVQD